MGYELETVIRGVAFWGYAFDDLEPRDSEQATAAGLPLSSLSGDLADCVITGDLPCTVEVNGERSPSIITFTLDLQSADRQSPSPKSLHLTLTVADQRLDVNDDWFEDGVLQLDRAIQDARASLICCVTCLYSDYSPAGHGLAGMRCHRDAKEQYLAVRSKRDYWSVPVTEDVLETYLCQEYQRRIPGTGYRG
jgi:hypothetical protein